MNLNSTIKLDLNLMIPDDFHLIKYELLDSNTKALLLDSRLWLKELSGWIQYIRGDLSLKCHDPIRYASALSMGLQFTDDITIKELNARWRSKEEKTDVLSFPVLDELIGLPKDECVELGDIVISLQTAQSQAIQQNHSLLQELRWLVSHGLLHLMGWEHQDDSQLEGMLNCQERLLGISQNAPFRLGYTSSFS